MATMRLFCGLIFVILLFVTHACIPRQHSVQNLYPSADPKAPSQFYVKWFMDVTSSDPVTLKVVRDWAPLGVDRFYQLILDNFYDCAGIFRVDPDFVIQFGIAAQPNETAKWNTTIPDDPVIKSNLYSYVSFATGGPDTRTTQIFINTGNNDRLDDMGFAPFAQVVSGMDTVLRVYDAGDDTISQNEYEEGGDVWLQQNFPNTTLILADDGLESTDDDEDDKDGDDWDTSIQAAVISGILIGGFVFSYLVWRLKSRYVDKPEGDEADMWRPLNSDGTFA